MLPPLQLSIPVTNRIIRINRNKRNRFPGESRHDLQPSHGEPIRKYLSLSMTLSPCNKVGEVGTTWHVDALTSATSFPVRPDKLSKRGLLSVQMRGYGPTIHDSPPQGLKKWAHRVHAEGCVHCRHIVTQNPACTRPRRRDNRLESRTINPLPRRTVYRISPTDLHPQALGDAVVDRGTENKNIKTRNRLRGKAFMVSPAGFEPVTTGIRRPAL